VTQKMRHGERREVGVDGVGAAGGRGGEGGELALTPTASRPSWPARRRRRPSRSGSAPCRPCTRRRRPASARGRGREVSLGSIPSPTRSRRAGRAARPKAERERERETHLLLVVGQGAPRLGDELALLEDARLALEHVRVDASCPNVGGKAARKEARQFAFSTAPSIKASTSAHKRPGGAESGRGKRLDDAPKERSDGLLGLALDAQVGLAAETELAPAGAHGVLLLDHVGREGRLPRGEDVRVRAALLLAALVQGRLVLGREGLVKRRRVLDEERDRGELLAVGERALLVLRARRGRASACGSLT